MSGKPTPVLPRFWAKVDKRGDDDCWNWTGSNNGSGYGQFAPHRRRLYAHRFSYELHKGPIPEGMQLDHLCRNRGCVNPAHLEAVTSGENTRRGVSVERTRERAAAITHCPQGHPYDDANTRRTPSGSRQCRTCTARRSTAWRINARQGAVNG